MTWVVLVALLSGNGMSRRGRMRWASGLAVGAIACTTLPIMASQVRGDTIESALMQAYQNNPSLNSQRAATRATDEGVPQALSGYRPRVTVTASGGEQSLSSVTKTSGIVP